MIGSQLARAHVIAEEAHRAMTAPSVPLCFYDGSSTLRRLTSLQKTAAGVKGSVNVMDGAQLAQDLAEVLALVQSVQRVANGCEDLFKGAIRQEMPRG